VISLVYEMTYTETIDGPIGRINGSARDDRVCWQITDASLEGPRISAALATTGTDWIRVGADGTRRQDLRASLLTHEGGLILLRYDLALIRPTERFLTALELGEATGFDDQYMRIEPQFEASAGRYAWLMENLFVGRGRLLGLNQIGYEIYRVL
jgi:hypothetical protein